MAYAHGDPPKEMVLLASQPAGANSWKTAYPFERVFTA